LLTGVKMKKLILAVTVISVVICVKSSCPAQEMKKGIDLFDKAYYEDALKEFRGIADSADAPDEDKIKAHYYMMKIHRAFGDDEKMKAEIREILALSPGYKVSNREPASLKSLFEEIRGSLIKEEARKEPSEIVTGVAQDMAVLEKNLSDAAAQQDALISRLNEQGKETRKTKFALGASVISLLILLAASVSFK